MANNKSKLPDLNELGSFATKLFKGIKNSVNEIVDEYKENRKPKPARAEPQASTHAKKTTTAKKTSDTKAASDKKPKV